MLIRGKVATFIKVAIVALISALLLTLTQSAFAKKEYVIAAFLAVAIFAINFTYFNKRTVPLKFFLPGILLLSAFVVTPILYTVVMSTYNYKTGNYISKEEAIGRIKALALEPDENNSAFDIVVGKFQESEAILVSDIENKSYFISTPERRLELQIDQVELDENFVAQRANGFTPLEAGEIASSKAATIRYFYNSQYFITVENLNVGAVFRQSLEYLPNQDIFKSLINDSIYRDNGNGNYVNPEDKSDFLEPGWRDPAWFTNYIRLVSDERVRDPLISVFIWTVVFATLTVLTQFSFGLLLALALNKPIRGRRIYRSILVLPYAMPSVMSILIWGGMFNTEFGAVNEILGSDIAWFQDPTFARFAVILVNLWLGFPYFYLVSSGSLQAIPSELLEAAAIDGANPRQVFSKVTLPLLLQILSPLLIASFAFNFNNFNLIYLLTGGGPREQLDGEIAGSTDILISYTYQIAFGSNLQDLGLASAISVLIFFLVASISLYGVRKSKVLESFT
ncbi:MAG TPA: ABC transporter permease subunit [Candidatus Nanopelagicaceae bacterium]|jgi:arabinogalactan oligomer/maltooligosaccharide transport system permease protein|nr:ABC transporter permease subunit [Candidatus Nanopelagicaceae bacterium]